MMKKPIQQTDLTKTTYKQRRNKYLHIRVSDAELEYLNKVANEQGYKLSGLVREALQAFVCIKQA